MFNDKKTIVSSDIEKAKKLEKQNNFQEALSIYKNLLDRYPEEIDVIFARGRLFQNIGKLQEALRDFNHLIKRGLNGYALLYNTAETLKLLKEYDQAISYYMKAITSKNDELYIYHAACDLMIRTNQISQARELVNLGFKVLPENPDLYSIEGKLFASEDNYKDADRAYSKALKSLGSSPSKNYILNEYAKVKEKLGKYDEAIDLIIKSKSDEKKRLDLKGASTEFIDNFIRKSSQINIEKDWQGKTESDNESPIFVVGFPRSGTTLMEQILYSHPHLAVSDENNIMPNMVFNMAKILKQKIDYPDGFNYLTKDKILKWRGEYYSRMATNILDFKIGQRIVDKNPMSFIYMLTIKRFFPESPVLMMIRDPRDVVLSCFFQNFTPNPSNMHFYSLEDCAKYYADAMGLYLKYRDNLNMNILQVSYEELCNDFEGSIRSIISHVNEDWTDDILNYYGQGHRYIGNPSFNAVTKEIDNSAIAKWENYDKHIEKVLPILDPFIKEFGYNT